MREATLFDELAAGMCDYGNQGLGGWLPERPCSRPATHAAVCLTVPYECGEGTGCGCDIGPKMVHLGSTTRIECCRDHADYYATAWVSPYPNSCRAMHEAVFIETLAVAA